MNNLGYVEVKIDKTGTEIFHQLVMRICNKDDFYKSDVVNYINGDVTSKLHLTIFYGCNATGKQLKMLKNYVNKINLPELKLDKLFLLPGYQNLYQILCVKVIDKDNKLKKIYQDISNYGHDPKIIHSKFLPHLTLAYVRSDYKIPPKFTVPKLVKIKSIGYFSDSP